MKVVSTHTVKGSVRTQRAHQFEHARQNRYLWEHGNRQHRYQQQAAPAKPHPPEGIGRRHPQQQRQADNDGRHNERIQNLQPERLFPKNRLVIDEGYIPKPIADLKQRRAGFERGENGVIEGKQRNYRDDQNRHGKSQLARRYGGLKASVFHRRLP
jgi:hypothetical protein